MTAIPRGRKTMRRGRSANLILASLLLMIGPIPSQPRGVSQQSVRADPGDGPRLASILKSMEVYCERIKGVALFYVCQEKVTDKEYFFRYNKGASGLKREEHVFDIRKVNVNSYLYDYQLVKNGDQLAENRVLLVDNGRKLNVQVSGLKNIESWSQFPVYGPVGFLSRYWQNHFRYAIVGEDVVDGLPAIVIQAVPTEEREDNYQFGRVWIGPDSQVLRLEFEPASLKDYQDEVLNSPLGEFHKKMVWTIDYSVEKNGIRFPGRHLIQKFFVRETDDHVLQKALKRETLFEYGEYKFFKVETEIRY
jgi:hypothetical protein